MEPWISDEVLHTGAEAVVTSGTWFGADAIKKQRTERKWRHPDLDAQLTKKRLQNEIKLMVKLRNKGLPLPKIFDVDLTQRSMIMERIDGEPLIDILRIEKNHESILHSVGKSIRLLHREAVTHGDLSTNNIMISKNETAILIDLGLAKVEYEVEGFGIDLHVLHEIFRASHPNIDSAMNDVIEGYLHVDEELGEVEPGSGGTIPSAQECVNRLEKIKQRVRYHSG